MVSIVPADLTSLAPNGHRLVTVDLATSRAISAYDIIIGQSVLDEVGALIFTRLGHKRCLVVTDATVGPLYAARCEAALIAAGHKILPTIVVPAGEVSKNFSTLETLLDTMLLRGLDRRTLVIALGGGVVGDLAGLAASLVMRGLDVIQVPTTLLAQVDSSVGGKTAIDTPRGKNMVGTFHHPRLVVIDVSILSTLPLRELRAGYAEILKYGIIRDKAFFYWCTKNAVEILSGNHLSLIHAVEMSCAHKAAVVAGDERDLGDRALLNFGHTFGHALEATFEFGDTLRHGEAVAIGMVMAFGLSVQLGYCSKEEVDVVRRHIESVGLPTLPPQGNYHLDSLMTFMAHDKKAEAGQFTLILTKGIGQAFVSHDIDRKTLESAWRETFRAMKIE